MTVNTTNITSGPYSGNGVADAFSYTFRIENKNQLRVFETDDTGVETELTVDTDYTVAGIGNDAGGTVTRVAGALPSGFTWYIRSNYVETQVTDFQSQGAFFPQIHESAIDKLTFLIQQITDRLGRAMKLSDSYSGAATTGIPDPEALKFLRWNAAGTGFENTFGTTSAVGSDVSTTDGNAQNDLNTRTIVVDSVADIRLLATSTGKKYTTTLGYSTPGDGGGAFYYYDAADTTTADDGFLCIVASDGGRWKLNHGEDVFVRWAGAKGDGVTDDYAAIQAALNYRGLTGGQVKLGNGVFLINTTLDLPDGVYLVGNITHPGGNKIRDVTKYATELWTGPGIGAITMSSNTGVVGIAIKPASVVYPQTQAQAAAWANTAIDAVGVSGVTVRNCMIGGYLRGFSSQNLGAQNTSRNIIDNVFIDCLNCVRIINSVDMDYINRVHCWPFLSDIAVTTDDIERVGVAFDFQEAGAWTRVTDCFQIGWTIGYRTVNTVHVNFMGCGSDYYAASVNAAPIAFQITGDSRATKIVGGNIGGDYRQGIQVNISSSEAASGVTISGTQISNAAANQQINIIDAEFVVLSGVVITGGTDAIRVASDMGLHLRADSGCRFIGVTNLITNAGAGFAANNVVIDPNADITGISADTINSVDTKQVVASAPSIKVPYGSDYIEVTGTATITQILNRVSNRTLYLKFMSGLTVGVAGNIVTKTGADTVFLAGEIGRFVVMGSTVYEV